MSFHGSWYVSAPINKWGNLPDPEQTEIDPERTGAGKCFLFRNIHPKIIINSIRKYGNHQADQKTDLSDQFSEVIGTNASVPFVCRQSLFFGMMQFYNQ
jgi:hypothetical protein